MKYRVKIAGILLIAALISGCYLVNNAADSGDIALNIDIPSRAVTGNTESSTAYLLGILVKASVEEDLRAVAADFQSGEFSFSQDEIVDFVNLALSSVEIFDGGNPFFQVPIQTLTSESGSGSFTVAGIPAEQDYFLILLVVEDRVDDAMDLMPSDFNNALDIGIMASTNVRYIDIESDDYSFTSFPDGETVYSSNGSTSIDESGWYFFDACDVSETGSLSGSIWCQNGSPVKAGPIRVEAGKTLEVPVMLKELD